MDGKCNCSDCMEAGKGGSGLPAYEGTEMGDFDPNEIDEEDFDTLGEEGFELLLLLPAAVVVVDEVVTEGPGEGANC